MLSNGLQVLFLKFHLTISAAFLVRSYEDKAANTKNKTYKETPQQHRKRELGTLVNYLGMRRVKHPGNREGQQM